MSKVSCIGSEGSGGGWADGFVGVYEDSLYKVSGIPSGNKLIKTIRYPHM